MAEKPVMWGESGSDAVADVYDEDYADARERGRDPSWIPGYSEVVKARDLSGSLALSEADKREYYKRFGTGPKEIGEIPYEFRWVRVSGPNDARSYSADVEADRARRDGFRPVTWKESGRGIPVSTIKEKIPAFEIPPAATKVSDGSIRRLDTALWAVDGARAKQNERKRFEQANKHERATEAETLERGSFTAGPQS